VHFVPAEYYVSDTASGLKYQHWPMKQTFLLTRKVVSGILYPYNSDKTNAQKSDIHKNWCL